MIPKANTVTARHLSLLRAYFLILQRVDRLPWLVWLPTGWLGFIRVPVLTVAVRVFASSHIKRVLESLDRTYQRRLAIDETGPDEEDGEKLRDQTDWKKLRDQAGSMNASLTPFLAAKWLFATLAFVLVFLVARTLPHGDLVIKMAGAAATVNPGKLTELASEPGAVDAFYRLIFVVLMMFIALTPVLIYHFRFKRALFNRPELLVASNPSVTFKTVWLERSISPAGLYVLEREMFTALGDPVLSETPLDLLAVVIAYLYHAVGPGLVVGIVAWHVMAVNRSVGTLLFFVAAINSGIGVANAFGFAGKIRQRSKDQEEA